jgi:hypothetical protein
MALSAPICCQESSKGVLALKPIIYKEVYYDINEDMGLEPNCHECTSHISRTPLGQVRCNRDGFRLLHKWVYWNTTGETPAVVKQVCENLTCINPAHMKSMTIEEAKQGSLPFSVKPPRRPPVGWGNRRHRNVRDPETLDKVWELHNSGLKPTPIGRLLGLDADIIRAIIHHQAYRNE